METAPDMWVSVPSAQAGAAPSMSSTSKNLSVMCDVIGCSSANQHAALRPFDLQHVLRGPLHDDVANDHRRYGWRRGCGLIFNLALGFIGRKGALGYVGRGGA